MKEWVSLNHCSVLYFNALQSTQRQRQEHELRDFTWTSVCVEQDENTFSEHSLKNYSRWSSLQLSYNAPQAQLPVRLPFPGLPDLPFPPRDAIPLAAGLSTEQIIMNGDDEEFRTFVNMHAGALRSSGVPQVYWRSLHHKITNEVRLLPTNIQHGAVHRVHVDWE